jgi:hypothetical protein
MYGRRLKPALAYAGEVGDEGDLRELFIMSNWRQIYCQPSPLERMEELSSVRAAIRAEAEIAYLDPFVGNLDDFIPFTELALRHFPFAQIRPPLLTFFPRTGLSLSMIMRPLM